MQSENCPIISTNGEMLHSQFDSHPTVVKPCYYIQRILGIYQPSNSGKCWQIYNYVGYFYALIVAGASVFLGLPSVETLQWAAIANLITTLLTFAMPLLYVKLYNWKMDYDEMIFNFQSSNPDMIKHLHKISNRYTTLAIFFFLILSVQAVFCLKSLLPANYQFYHVLAIGLFVIFGCSCWAIWIVTYCFECHILFLELHKFKLYLEDSVGRFSLDECFMKFGDFKRKLHKSQTNLHLVLSFAVFVHFTDMLVYTLAFFGKDFSDKHTIWIYVYGLSMDAVSIFVKLVPAAWISSKLSELVDVTTELCIPSEATNWKVNDDLLKFLHYLHISTQAMGFRILTVRVTAQITTSAIISYVSLLATAVKLLENKIL